MAETNDINAHSRSLSLQPNSVPMLNGMRFNNRSTFDSNQYYAIPQSTWDDIRLNIKSGNLDKLIKLAQWYVNDHYVNQVPRLLQLERYYQADNDIHYWRSDKKNRADNRIASGLPRYITNIRVGYQFGNPLTYGYSNKDNENDNGDDLLNQIAEFNNQCDEPYHEKIMGKNIANTGRGYELLYVLKDTNNVKVTSIDPATCFVVYNTSVERNELFAVRYYAVNVQDKTTYQIELYTDNKIYYFSTAEDPASSWKKSDEVDHFFKHVPITEYVNNEDRIGIWETKLDEIDAYDKSLSEMANSQEDFSNATLVVSGDVDDLDEEKPLLDNSGNQVYINFTTGEYTNNKFDDEGNLNKMATYQPQIDTGSNVMFLKPALIRGSDGSVTVNKTEASYLTKQLDASEWETYINRLLADIHKDTNTPDTSDANFSSNASGVAMSYKLWGADQERSIAETLFKRGIKRRLRLLVTYWDYLKDSKINITKEGNPADNVTISFTPNLPKNDNENIQNAQSAYATGVISEETARNMLAGTTGVESDQEKIRVDREKDENSNRDIDMANKLYGKNQKDDDSDKVDDEDEE